jgi:hypothetical protein
MSALTEPNMMLTASKLTTKEESHKRLLFVHIAQKPADNGPHSRFFHKVNPFQKIFTKNSHFQFFPLFPETLRSRPGHRRRYICDLPTSPAADGRRRPCFRSVRPYANFLLLLATFHMAPIFPESRSADRLNGKPQFYSRSQNLGRCIISWKIIQER